MSDMDDILESWEEIEESGTLDKRLDALRLNTVSTLDDIESTGTNTRMIILGGGINSQYMAPKPTVKILKRPNREPPGNGDGPLTNGEKPKQPIKSLKQREQEYAEARKRIMGEEKSPEENLPVEINRIEPKLSNPGSSNLPTNIIRMPFGPDGTRGFNVRRKLQRDGYEAIENKYKDALLSLRVLHKLEYSE